MSETAPREVESAMPVSASTGAAVPLESPGRREVTPEGTTTAPGFPPLAATRAPAGGKRSGSPGVVEAIGEFAVAAAALAARVARGKHPLYDPRAGCRDCPRHGGEH